MSGCMDEAVWQGTHFGNAERDTSISLAEVALQAYPTRHLPDLFADNVTGWDEHRAYRTYAPDTHCRKSCDI